MAANAPSDALDTPANLAMSRIRKAFRDHVYRHRITLVVERELATPRPPENDRWQFRWLEAQDLRRLEHHFPNHEQMAERGRKFLEQGCLGFGGLDDSGHLVSVLFVATRDFYDEYVYKHLFRLGNGRVYQFAGMVAPKMHRGGVGEATLAATWRMLDEAGYRTTTAAVSEDSRQSIGFHFAIGFRESGEMLHSRKLFNHYWSSIERYEGQRHAELLETSKV